MARKTKVKIPRTCPYGLFECKLPQGETCPDTPTSQDPDEWRRQASHAPHHCGHCGYEMSTKGWREKYLLLDEKQIEERQKRDEQAADKSG